MRFAGRSDQREWICSVSGRRAVGGSPHLLSLGAHGSRSASTTGLPHPYPALEVNQRVLFSSLALRGFSEGPLTGWAGLGAPMPATSLRKL